MDTGVRIPTVNDLRVRFHICFFFSFLLAKDKLRSNFAIYAERKNVMTVVTLLFFDNRLEVGTNL